MRAARTLLSGDALASLCGLAALVLAARRLPAPDLGTLILIQAYVEGVESLATFNSWQALIHFGAGALERGDREELGSLVRLCAGVDFASAAAGAVISAAGAVLLRGLFHWSASTAGLAVLYSLVMLAPYHGAPLGVLRIFSRFGTLAGQGVATALTRLAAIAVAYLLHLHLVGFVVVWLASDLFERLSLLALAWRELCRQGYRGSLRTRLSRRRRGCSGLGRFLVGSNVLGSIGTTTTYADVVVVGGLLGPAAAGAYRIGKQLVKGLVQVSDPVTEVLYPALAGLWAQRRTDAFRSLCLRLAGIGAALGAVGLVLLAVSGRLAIRLVFGARYLTAFPMMMWMMVGVALALATLPLKSATLAMGRTGRPVGVLALAAACYMTLLLVLLRWVGLQGAGMAFTAYELVWIAGVLPPTLLAVRRLSPGDQRSTSAP